MKEKVISTAELQVGDTVRYADGVIGAWGSCIVKNVTVEEVTLFRPYGTCEDFLTSSGVICYIGLEEYKVLKNENSKWILYARKELK